LTPQLDAGDRPSAGEIVLPTGEVVGIVRRAWKPLCGALLPALMSGGGAGGGATSALFAPADRRLPRVRIRTRQAAALHGQRIVVAVDRWPRSSRYPLGHYVRTLGPLGDAATETEALLLQHDIPHHPYVHFVFFMFAAFFLPTNSLSRFSPDVLACLPPHPWSLANEDAAQLQRRVDLRHIRIASVDPPGCTDIDDALHCRRLANGNFEVIRCRLRSFSGAH
jgi:exosome complex exonuclease DIS3/RRP44